MPVVSVNAALYVVFQSAIPVTSFSPFSPAVVYVMAGVIEAIPFVLQEAAVLNACSRAHLIKILLRGCPSPVMSIMFTG